MPMDDDRLQSLLRMSREAEALDRDLRGTTLHDAHARGAALRPRRVRLVGALTACLLVLGASAVVVMVNARINGGSGGSGVAPPRVAKVGPDAKSPGIKVLPGTKSGPGTESGPGANRNMMIAMYRPDDGHVATCPECWCVERWDADFGRDLSAVGDEELIGASIERSCVKTPARMVVIGLSGPADSLPSSDAQAREVAMCILDKSDAGAPVGCVASNVDVRVKTWNR